jgi:hypothetical protein
MRPGGIVRRDGEYQGRGTANAFRDGEPKASRRFTKVTPYRAVPQLQDYLLKIASAFPDADTIHLVMDTQSFHGRKAQGERFSERIGNLLWERFTVNCTSKHRSWLNQAEIEISMFSS